MSTAPISPLSIAQSALPELEALSDSDPRKTLDNLFACREFVEYLDLCEQRGFVIKGYDTKTGKFKKHLLEYGNRWGNQRRKELSGKLMRLQHWFELKADTPVTMITLTSYHEGHSVSGAWEKLNKSREKLLKLIAKYCNSPDYFWVVEPHKSGYVHYHLAVFADIDNKTKDSRGQGIEDKFRNLWSKKYKTGNHTYGLDFSQKKDGDKIQHLKNYLEKYLRKGFLLDKWTPGMLIFNAFLHDTGYRMYGASKNIRDIMNIDDEDNNQTVWLETRLEGPQKDEDTGEFYEQDRVVWYRQYIPDWLDSDFWLQKSGDLRIYDPEALYIFDWGRKSGFYGCNNWLKVTSYKDCNKAIQSNK